MEVLTLRYYLRIFSLFAFFLLLIVVFYSFFSLNKILFHQSTIINIKKGESFQNIIDKNLINSNFFDKKIFISYYKLNYYFKNEVIHYGDFYIEDSSSLLIFLKKISKPSNVLNKITIIEGWSKSDLNKELSKYFSDFQTIEYEDILADTYYFNKSVSFEDFLENLINVRNLYFENNQDRDLLKKYKKKELIIIGSLLEKEGLGHEDKRKISSVIFNRLHKKMKLQIDATVIYALTEGKNNLNRKLLISDLKFDHPYNTYVINGLTPNPISYVGPKTIDIILENYKSDYLFYFYNKLINKHVFSKDYKTHKIRLNEYRKIR